MIRQPRVTGIGAASDRVRGEVPTRLRADSDAAAHRSPDTRNMLTRPVGFDTLATHWQVAFDVAADALLVANGCRSSLGFRAQELDERRGRLARERDATRQLLAVITHERWAK